MIIALGINHTLQWPHNIPKEHIANIVKKNINKYLPFLRELIIENNIKIVGEEAAPGLFMKEIMRRDNINSSFLQNIAKKRKLKYFQFDLPPDQLLQKYGVESYHDKKYQNVVTKITDQEREKWFVKIITDNISQSDNGLVMMGFDHLTRMVKLLINIGYKVKAINIDKIDWYEDYPR